MLIYHGSDHIIERPLLNAGKTNNDYGQGFYCTEKFDMAGEWACKDNKDGFINSYELNTDGLTHINLCDGNYTILNWIALLLKNRKFSLNNEIAVDTRNYIIGNFSVDLNNVDVVTGYRADDSYFGFAESFVENGLPVRSLAKAMYLGKLGLQTVLVSQKAFDNLTFKNAVNSDKLIYYPKFKSRDLSARENYKNEIKNSKTYKDDIFVMDIMRQEIKNDDERLQRIVFE